MHNMQSRRDFLTTVSAAGAVSVLGAQASFADEGPPETTTIGLASLGGYGPRLRSGRPSYGYSRLRLVLADRGQRQASVLCRASRAACYIGG
jgi:hypothetical protein